MAVDHPAYIARQLEFDVAMVLHLVVFENQKDASVSRAMQVPFEMDLGKVLHPDRTDEEDGDGQRIFAGEGGQCRV